jgi:YggT family protein
VIGYGPISLLLTIFWWILLLHVIFSWVPRPPEPIVPFVLGVRRVVEPVAAPLRRVIPPLRLGGVALDLSILVLFFGVRILSGIARSVGW